MWMVSHTLSTKIRGWCGDSPLPEGIREVFLERVSALGRFPESSLIHPRKSCKFRFEYPTEGLGSVRRNRRLLIGEAWDYESLSVCSMHCSPVLYSIVITSFPELLSVSFPCPLVTLKGNITSGTTQANNQSTGAGHEKMKRLFRRIPPNKAVDVLDIQGRNGYLYRPYPSN